jgi:hypothetical protein
MGGLDIGAIIDLVNGVMGATKPKQDGEEGTQIDVQKLGLVVLTFAGRQGLSWFLRQRRQKQEAKLLSKGIKPEARSKKKGNKFVPGLVIGGALGLIGYLLVMKPEDRENLFKNIDKTVDEVVSLVNEIQGKPYTSNYEK